MKNKRRSRSAEILSEITTKGYFGRIQQRAARRKSPWNLLDLPMVISCWALLEWVLLHAIWAVRNMLLPQYAGSLSALLHSQRDQLAHGVFFVGIFLAVIPSGMVLSNFIVWSIPSYRRAIAPEAKGVWHGSFRDSQKDLALIALYAGIPSLLASLAAAMFIR